MGQINIQVGALAFADSQPSNNPLLRHFDFVFKLYGIQSQNPDQRQYLLAPNEERAVYDGTRTSSLDNTTAFDVTRPNLTSSVYRFTRSAGTQPAFRTDRNSGVTTSTAFNITVNGPVATFSSTAGPFSTASIQIGDVLHVESGAGPSAANQGLFTIIGKTSTSVDVKSLDAAAESFTVLDTSQFMIYSNGGGVSNQIQVDDKVMLSAGFSPATQGTYSISAVTPTWFEINVGDSNGIPLEAGIIPTSSGIVFYSSAKKFVLIAAQNKVSVKFNTETNDNAVIEAIEANNPEKPGLLLKNGFFYKLSIKNLSLTPTTVIVASGD